MGCSPLSHLSACAPILRRAAPRGRPRGLHVAAGGRLRRTRRSQPAFTPGKRAREAAASGDTERGKPHRLPGAAGPASRCGPDGAPRPPERPGTAAFRAPAAGGRLYLPRGRPARMGRTGGGPARAPPPQSTAAPAAPGPSPTRRVRHSHVTRRPRRRAPRSASRGRRCPLVPAGSCSSSATPGPPRRRPEPAATRTAAPAACGGGNVNKWGFIATSLECRVHLPLRSVPNRRGASSSSCSSCRCRRYAIRQPLLRQPPARSPHSPLRTVRIASPQPARPNAEPFPPLPPRLASPSPTPPPATKMA